MKVRERPLRRRYGWIGLVVAMGGLAVLLLDRTGDAPHLDDPVMTAADADCCGEADRRVDPSTPLGGAARAEADDTCCGEGRLNLYVMAKTPFDAWTSEGADWSWFEDHYASMVVWEPYWDSRLPDYSRVTVYRNAYAIKIHPDRDARVREHPEWILRDAAGDPVYIPYRCDGTCPQYAADVGNQEYRDHWLADIEALADKGYRGLYIDDVNLAWRFSDGNGDPVTPVDPRTGRALTLTDWQRDLTEFLEQVRAALPDFEIWHNSIWYADAPAFDSPLIDRQIRAADVIQLERGMNDPGLTQGSGRFGMETFLRYADRVHSLGTSVAMLDEHAVDEKGQWYNIAGALLVNDGTDLVTTEDWERIAPTGLFRGFLTDLGDAVGPREVVDGVITREFTDGLVVLNQPRSDATVVELAEPWMNDDGTLVTSVELAPSEAVLLRRPSAAP